MSTIAAILTAAAITYGIPARTLLAVCWVESAHTSLINPKDGGSASYGPCQIKLATARGVDPSISPARLLDPASHARIAARVFRRFLDRYHGRVDCAVVAYNRGRARCGSRVLDSSYLTRVRAAEAAQPWLGAR